MKNQNSSRQSQPPRSQAQMEAWLQQGSHWDSVAAAAQERRPLAELMAQLRQRVSQEFEGPFRLGDMFLAEAVRAVAARRQERGVTALYGASSRPAARGPGRPRKGAMTSGDASPLQPSPPESPAAVQAVEPNTSGTEKAGQDSSRQPTQDRDGSAKLASRPGAEAIDSKVEAAIERRAAPTLGVEPPSLPAGPGWRCPVCAGDMVPVRTSSEYLVLACADGSCAGARLDSEGYHRRKSFLCPICWDFMWWKPRSGQYACGACYKLGRKWVSRNCGGRRDPRGKPVWSEGTIQPWFACLEKWERLTKL